MPDVPLPKPQKPSVPQAGSAIPNVGNAMPPSAGVQAASGAINPPPTSMSNAVAPSVSPASATPKTNTVTSTPPLGGAAPASVSPVPPSQSSIPGGSLPPAQNTFKPGMNQPPTVNRNSPIPQMPTASAQVSGMAGMSGTNTSKDPSAQSTQTGASNTPLTPATSKKSFISSLTSSPIKLVAIVGVLLLLIGGVSFAVSGMFGRSNSVSVNTPTTGNNQPAGTAGQAGGAAGAGSRNQTVLTYWGLWQPSEVLEEVFTEFEAQNPGVTIEYLKQNHVDYRERLQTAIASGSGPDVFRFHASWVPMLSQELDPVPSSVMSVSEFQNTFFPVAARQLQLGGKLVGIPLMYDGLGLYINTEIFRQAALAEPTTWAELKSTASQLTVRNASGEVERGGLAIGNASNVEHFGDILGLLMIQNGADLNDPTSKAAADALSFYTGFYRNDRVWSDKLPSSTVAFARGEVAMMFAPSWRVHEIQAMNPEFTDFKIIPTPTLGGQSIPWATYWAEGVNSKSTQKAAAWSLLKYMSSPEVMEKLYSEQSQVRLFGELYSRVDLAQELVSSQDSTVQNYIAPFLESAPDARSWYLNTYTHDNGINDQLLQYYRDAINAVNAGRSAEEAMETVSQGTQQVLRQYGATTGQ